MRMYLTAVWILLLLVINNSIDVYGWGFVGHSLVARLAQTRLTDETSIWVKKLIPWHWNGQLSSMSAWADQILYENSNPTSYPNWQWSRPHHFLNTPDWSCEYQRERDCADGHCIHSAILNYTSRLMNEDLPEVQHQEALFFLIHHLGDIHQPLHTGFSSDYGGNSIKIYFLNNTRSINLHSLWDSHLITHRLNQDFSSNASFYYDYLQNLLTKQSIKTSDDDNIEEWIKENLKLICQQVYFDESGKKLNRSSTFLLKEKYYELNIPFVEDRLVHAGVRLARLLNRIVSERNQPKPTATATTTTSVVWRKIWIFIGIGVSAAVIVFIGLICVVIYRKNKA